jgi:hypothetical protein
MNARHYCVPGVLRGSGPAVRCGGPVAGAAGAEAMMAMPLTAAMKRPRITVVKKED